MHTLTYTREETHTRARAHTLAQLHAHRKACTHTHRDTHTHKPAQTYTQSESPRTSMRALVTQQLDASVRSPGGVLGSTHVRTGAERHATTRRGRALLRLSHSVLRRARRAVADALGLVSTASTSEYHVSTRSTPTVPCEGRRVPSEYRFGRVRRASAIGSQWPLDHGLRSTPACHPAPQRPTGHGIVPAR
jgi:hypothetical protein